MSGYRDKVRKGKASAMPWKQSGKHNIIDAEGECVAEFARTVDRDFVFYAMSHFAGYTASMREIALLLNDKQSGPEKIVPAVERLIEVYNASIQKLAPLLEIEKGPGI